VNPIKLVVFDRDGTINEDRDDYVKSADEWLPLPGALEALARLNHAGWHAVVATNQSGIGRGLFEMAALNAMHAKMNRLLQHAGGRIDAVFFCPHVDADGCDCRKPLPGLLHQIGEPHGVDLRRSFMVGDRWSDVEAGRAAGCTTVLIDMPYSRRERCAPDYIAADLPDGLPPFVYLMRRAWAAEHPGVAAAFQAAMAEAVAFAEANPDAAREIYGRNVKLPPEALATIRISKMNATVTPDQIERWDDMMRRQGMLRKPLDARRLLQVP